jgi:hypothetical protein
MDGKLSKSQRKRLRRKAKMGKVGASSAGRQAVAGAVASATKAAVETVTRELINHKRAGTQSNYIAGSAGAGGARAAICAIAAPGESGGFRWSSEFSEAPTAVAQPWARITAGWLGSGAPLPDRTLGATDCIGLLRRIPQCALILYDYNRAGATFTYLWKLAGINGAGNHIVANEVDLVLPKWPADVPLKVVTAVPTSSYKPHGNMLFAGGCAGEPALRWFWVGKRDSIAFKLYNNDASPRTFWVRLFTFDGHQGVQVGKEYTSGAVASGSFWNASIATPLAGLADPGKYVAMAFGVDTDTNLAFTMTDVTLSGDGEVLCHLPIPGLPENVEVTQGIRMNGLSLMYSNRASYLKIEGSVYGVQVGGDKPWVDLISNTDAVSQLQGCVEMHAVNGMYGFLKPGDIRDADIKSFTTVSGSSVVDSFWPINDSSSYLCLYIHTETEAEDGFWTARFSLEYRTNDVWRATSSSELPATICAQAKEAVKEMQQFYENPNHLKAILGKVWQLGRRVAQHAPAALAFTRDYVLPTIKMGRAMAGSF